MVKPLVTVGHQAHQINYLPPLDLWPDRNRQQDDRAHFSHAQLQEYKHKG